MSNHGNERVGRGDRFRSRFLKGGAVFMASLALAACGTKVDHQSSGNPDLTTASASATHEAPKTSAETTPSTLDPEAIIKLPLEKQAETIEALSTEQLREVFAITDAQTPTQYAEEVINRYQLLTNAGCSPKTMDKYTNKPSAYNEYMVDHYTPAAEALFGEGGYNKKSFEINRIGMGTSCTTQAAVIQQAHLRKDPSVSELNDFYRTFKIVPGSLTQEDTPEGWNITFQTDISSTLTAADITADNRYQNGPAGNPDTMVNNWKFTGVEKTNGSYLPQTWSTKLATDQ